MEAISEYALSDAAEKKFHAFAADHYSKFDFTGDNIQEQKLE